MISALEFVKRFKKLEPGDKLTYHVGNGLLQMERNLALKELFFAAKELGFPRRCSLTALTEADMCKGGRHSYGTGQGFLTQRRIRTTKESKFDPELGETTARGIGTYEYIITKAKRT